MKPKNLLFVIGFFCFYNFVLLTTDTAKIYDGSIKLTTQAEVDSFAGKGYTTITGDLRILGNKTFGSSTIINLTALNSIDSIGGKLVIFWNSELNSLDGLRGITSVGGDISISGNPFLTDLDGLSGIISVGGLHISGKFTNLDALRGITSVGGDISQFRVVLL